MRLTNPEVVADLYDATKALQEGEATRRAAIEGKATSLLAATGVSVSVVSAFWASILKGPPSLGVVGTLAIIVLVLTGLAGGCAGLFAVLALRMRKDILQVNELDVFRDDVLKNAEACEQGTASPWRKYMIVHHFRVALGNGTINEQKARHVWRGQVAFGAFMLGVFLLSGVGTLAMLVPSPGQADGKQEEPSPSASAPN